MTVKTTGENARPARKAAQVSSLNWYRCQARYAIAAAKSRNRTDTTTTAVLLDAEPVAIEIPINQRA